MEALGPAAPGVTPEWRERLERASLAPLRATSRAYVVWTAALIVIVAWGVFAWATQLNNGLIVTGMRDRISWGVYIASFVFFIGISHAGTLLSAILRAAKARWQLSITRMAELITVVALCVGALMPIIDMGRADRVLNLIWFGRWQSPLVWDILAITTSLTGSSLYLLLPLIPDFALARDRLGPNANRFRRILFSAAAVGYHGTPVQRKALEKAMTVMMVVIIPVAVSVHTVVSWIFAMTLRDPFNTTVFGPFFVAGAIYSGVAAIILLMAVLRRVMHFEEFITLTQFKGLGYLLGAFTLIMGYFNLQEYAVHGYKLEGQMAFHFEQLMTGPFALLFWTYILGCIVLPGLLILYPRTRTIRGITAAAVLALVGMYIERYLIVVAGFRVPLMPYDPSSYSPTWVELSILAGAIGLFLLIITVFVKLFPVISVWEVIEHRGPEVAVPLMSIGIRPARVASAGLVSVAMLAGTIAGFMLGGTAGAADPIATQLTLTLPAGSAIGQPIDAQVRLTDSRAAPVGDAKIRIFTSQAFLGGAGSVTLADGLTDAAGTLSVQFDIRTAGEFDVTAAYAGDATRAPSRAQAKISVADGGQLYSERLGVSLPGVNVAPVTVDPASGGPASALAGLWPRFSGWPIALVLIVVWSLYLYVATLVAGISRTEAQT